MRKYRVFLVVLLTVAMLLGCTVPSNSGGTVTGSGNVVTQEEDFSGFDNLEVSHAFRVTIRQGDAYRVVVRVDDNLVQYLRVSQVGSTVQIDLTSGVNVQKATMEAEVTMPSLGELDLSGASSVTVTGFDTEEAFRANLSGASDLQGSIQAGDVRLDVSGASHVSLTGSAGDLTLNVSGASNADLSEFRANDGEVEASGASTATVYAVGRLYLEATGASHIYYVGSPTIERVESSGSSTIGQK